MGINLLERRIKCTSVENIYDCSTHSKSSHQLKTISKKKGQDETQIWSNLSFNPYLKTQFPFFTIF
jgi:hypothetical protein